MKVTLVLEVDDEVFARDPHFAVWSVVETAAVHVPRRWDGSTGTSPVKDNDWNVVGHMTVQREADYEEAEVVQ